ncbi:hypothetical protein VD0002_g6049 [Verticillium dahliae]|uniref:Uncharacterized protein n=1 Tax=Verticillium dahliae TaxID=27337 RepID=A0AA44WPY5_VERDA|nr:hypothetical protein BJF96_g2758 [Verticillium dahliae]PNH37687.1 hypothetical protein VD0004_g9108 [Verticillium dahliae]PNH49342.1 hypothetical protein VD0003_g7798 [Verticillium dahliae]PNH61842.1 hypothetical protein VD0002_g6049 [Verticillium dahliae]PNH64755.1 hypothetical protein VD0001_g8734 [Verticillium dahliae]
MSSHVSHTTFVMSALLPLPWACQASQPKCYSTTIGSIGTAP